MIINKKKFPNYKASFSLKNRITRLIWNTVYLIFFRYSPKIFHRYRIFILKLFGAKINWNNYIYNNVDIWAPWNLEIGNNNGIANNVIIYNIEKIKIGNNNTISQGSYLCTGTHDYNSKNFQLYAKNIILKNNVWLCAQTFIGPGVIIENGIVVGARSVVNNNLKKQWSVFSGHTAKYLKKRKKLKNFDN